MFTKIREHMENRDEGFTLIELLVVVIIIGILAAIAIPVFLRQRERGWAAAAESDARNAAVSVETAYTNTGGPYAVGSASPTVAGTGSLVGFKPSDKVTTTVTLIGDGYCIQSKHEDSKDVDTAWLPSIGSLVRQADAPAGCS